MNQTLTALRATTADLSKDQTAIRPFAVPVVAQTALDDLRRRIAATRWPEKETVADQTQGVQLATMQALAKYWGKDYDWRKCEARSYELISRVFNGESEGLTRDDVLDNITITWLTNTFISGARLYWEYFGKGYFDAKGVAIPTAVSVFPDELYSMPRSWTEKAYPKLIFYNKHDKGGHFAAWEQPDAITQDLRATFKSLR